MDGPGADAAAALLRKSGREVEIVQPPKVVQFWAHCSLVARLAGEHEPSVTEIAQLDHSWLAMGETARKLSEAYSKALAAKPWIDPDIVALMDGGEFVWAPLYDADDVRPGLSRSDGEWSLTCGLDEFAAVSDRFAAAWLAEFDGGDRG